MRPNGDHPTPRLATVQEAAQELGITVEAVRSRLRRGTLHKEKGEDGTTYVVIEARSSTDHEPNDDRSDARTLLEAHLDSLKSENEFLRRELERKDHLLVLLR